MKYKKLSNCLIISFVFLFYSYHSFCQNTVAKLKYEDAEKAFYDGDYQSCIGGCTTKIRFSSFRRR